MTRLTTTLLILLTVLLGASGVAHAAKLTVERRGDVGDLAPGNGRCDSSSKRGAQCTLRAAIEEANASAGRDAIKFDIGGTGAVKTIAPQTELPEITAPVAIDGYSQRAARPNTQEVGDDAKLRVELDGAQMTGAGDPSGLKVSGGQSVIRGLVINNFSRGIELVDGDGSFVLGNFIGTDPTGTLGEGNAYGITLGRSSSNVIGGPEPADRNLISNSTINAIWLVGSADNRIEGNYLGTDRAGTADLGNGLDLGDDGIRFEGDSVSNRVGGQGPGFGNVIAHTAGYGVNVLSDDSVGNSILSNSIHHSERGGINIDAEGVAANDPGDPDVGGNLRQNHPVLTSAQRSSSGIVIGGTLNSAPNSSFTLQFFSNPADEEIDEGQRLLGTTQVSTNAAGDAPFATSFSGRVLTGSIVTATATDSGGNTSEFSPGRVVVPPPVG